MEVITKDTALTIFGFGGIATNKDYTGTAFKLSGQMWEIVKRNNIKNKGKNIWVYLPNNQVFAGVELEDLEADDHGLEKLSLRLTKYAYFKHVGPYQLIKQAGQHMRDELARQGLASTLPYIEIYGHWKPDESELETELIMSLDQQ